MSLYYEAAEVLTEPTNAGGSLKNRIFSKKELKSPPAQVFALVIETCKWSSVLREVIEHTQLLSLERKLTPLLSLLLVHDFLLAKKGIALPATHGLRSSIERHKGRLTAELAKARIRRSCGSMEALTEHVESGLDNTSTTASAPHPRWIRINTLKTTLDKQLSSTFQGFETADHIDDVRVRGSQRVYLDEHIPNLVAIPASVDLTKSKAYTSGSIIFQDKASCFPAYLLQPEPRDGDVIDSCAAPGNKTTHAAAVMVEAASGETREGSQRKVYAFEKDKRRAEVLKKMVALAGSDHFTQVHGGQDFLRVDPTANIYSNVGALLLDPSCSGSGIVGRDDMPELHLPVLKAAKASRQIGHREKPPRPTKKPKVDASDSKSENDSLKRKRDDEDNGDELETLVDDDGVITAMASGADLESRLTALSKFQLDLLLHAMAFSNARKITYSTCSIHFEENENVVLLALASNVAQARGWKILQRQDQVEGLRKWPVRGINEGGEREVDEDIRDACIRANKGDEHGTMGFFLAGFVRDGSRNEKFTSILVSAPNSAKSKKGPTNGTTRLVEASKAYPVTEDDVGDVEWGGFEAEASQVVKPAREVKPKKESKPAGEVKAATEAKPTQKQQKESKAPQATKEKRPVHYATRPNLLIGKPLKKQKKNRK